MSRSILFTLTVVLLAFGLEAQDIRLRGVVLDDATARGLEGAVIIICVDDQPIDSLVSDSAGGYEMILGYDLHYRIIYNAEGRVPKNILIDATGIPEKENRGGFGMSVDMRLFLIEPEMDHSFLKEPMGFARYDTGRKNMVWDLDYSKRMKERLDAARRMKVGSDGK